jgi:hypothetical protein
LKDVVRGQEKLNLAFVANLFNNHPSLDPPVEVIIVIEESREEKVAIVLNPINLRRNKIADVSQLDELS